MNTLNRDLLNLYGSYLFLAVGILFYYQTKKRGRNTPTLTAGFVVAFVGQFSNSFLRLNTEVVSGGARVNILQGLSVDVSYDTLITLTILFVTATNAILAFFWIFLEHTNAVQIERKHLILVSLLTGMYLWSYYLGINLKSNELFLYGDLLFTVLLNVLVIRSIYILAKVYVATGKERIAMFQLSAFILILVWAVNAFVFTLQKYLVNFFKISTFFPDYTTLTDVLYYLGLAIFILTVLLRPDYIYRLPLQIQDIVIMSSFGTAVYGIGKNAAEKSLDEQMLAGFVSAANSFVKEMQPTFQNEVIKVIQSSERVLRMEFGRHVGVCLVSRKENLFLLKSVRAFVKYIDQQNPQELIESGQFYEDQTVRTWLRKFFPYLDIKEMESY